MSTALATVQAQLSPFDPRDLAEATGLAGRLSKSGLVPAALRNKPEDTLLVMIAGRELGFSTVQSFRSFYVTNGKLGMYADAMVGMCVGRPECVYFRLVESTDKVATYETLRRGSPEPVKLSYTLAQAQRAKLVGNETYSKHTEAMLRARCSSALARVVYPDMLAGIYNEHELEEITAPRSPTGPRLVQSEPVVTEEIPVTGAESVEPPAQVDADFGPPPDFDAITGEVVDEVARVPFGKKQGTAVIDLTVRDLEWYTQAARKSIADPSKERFREKEEAWLAALLAEAKRRGVAA